MGLSVTQIQNRTLASLEKRIEEIALLPAVVAKLAALDLESDDASTIIERLARSDPAFALRLMRLANAGPYEHGTIDTIPNALLKIGTRHLSEVIRSLSVIEVFVPHTQGQKNLWIHSIQTSLAASRIAALRPELHVGIEEAFLAGLLHDVGRLLIFENHPAEMAKIDEAEVTDLRDLIKLEIQLCGFDHAALGNVVCERLKLPWTICEMVRTHHFYRERKTQIPSEVMQLVRLIQEADCLSFSFLARHSGLHRLDEGAGQIRRMFSPIDDVDRLVSPERWAEELRNIHRDSRLAAAFIDFAYPYF